MVHNVIMKKKTTEVEASRRVKAEVSDLIGEAKQRPKPKNVIVKKKTTEVEASRPMVKPKPKAQDPRLNPSRAS